MKTKVIIKDPIIDPYYIIKDEYNYIVQKNLGLNEKGKESSKSISYHSNIERCLEYISNLPDFYEETYKSINEYLNKIREIRNKILNLKS